MADETTGSQPQPLEPSRNVPRKYYPPGVFEELTALRANKPEIDFTSDEVSDEFRRWSDTYQKLQEDADKYLKAMALAKSIPPPEAQRVSITYEVDNWPNPAITVNAVAQFTQGEVDEIINARRDFVKLVEIGNRTSGIERDYIVRDVVIFPVWPPTSIDPSSREVSLVNRPASVLNIFLAARAAETALFEIAEGEIRNDVLPLPFDPNSKQRLKRLVELPDKLHPLSAAEASNA